MSVDFNGIESSINRTIKNIRNNNLEGAANNFAEYINKGTEAPGFARLAQLTGIEDSARFWDKEVFEGRIPQKEAAFKHFDTGFNLKKFWGICKEEADAFKDAYKKTYPRTWKKRLSIETCLHEVMGETKPASDLKCFKKIDYFFRKFSKKMF